LNLTWSKIENGMTFLGFVQKNGDRLGKLNCPGDR
jgi:hypothetical protein